MEIERFDSVTAYRKLINELSTEEGVSPVPNVVSPNRCSFFESRVV